MCHHTRPRRQAGCRHSRSRLLECLYIRTRKISPSRCKRRKRQARLRSRQRHHRCRQRQRQPCNHHHTRPRRQAIAVTVAVACWNVCTSALVDLTWTIANTASVSAPTQSSTSSQMPSASAVSCAITTTHAQGVKLVAVTVAIASWDAITTANAALVSVQTRTIVGVC